MMDGDAHSLGSSYGPTHFRSGKVTSHFRYSYTAARSNQVYCASFGVAGQLAACISERAYSSAPSAVQSSTAMNMNQSIARCPGIFTFQCSAQNKTDLDIGIAPAYFSIVSSSVACLMAPLILVAYAAFEEMRKSTAQKLVTLIALADTLAAIAFIIGGINYLIHYKADHGCNDFQKICATQSFLVVWSSNATYVLTPILTFHYLLTFSESFHWGQWLKRRLGWITAGPAYICAGFVLPLILAIILLMTNKLGFSPYAASTWCYIDFDDTRVVRLVELSGVVAAMLLGGWLWGVLSLLTTTVCYIAFWVTKHKIKQHLETAQEAPRQQQSSTLRQTPKQDITTVDVDLTATCATQSYIPPPEFSTEFVSHIEAYEAERRAYIEKANRIKKAVDTAERRIRWIPLVFILLHVFDTIQILASFSVSSLEKVDSHGCTSEEIQTFFLITGVLEAIGDGGQGWGNAIIYILFSKSMREKMFLSPARKVKMIIGGLWRQRSGRKERQVSERQLCIPTDDEELDSKRDLLTGKKHHVLNKDQTTCQVQYTKPPATYGAASM